MIRLSTRNLTRTENPPPRGVSMTTYRYLLMLLFDDPPGTQIVRIESDTKVTELQVNEKCDAHARAVHRKLVNVEWLSTEENSDTSFFRVSRSLTPDDPNVEIKKK